MRTSDKISHSRGYVSPSYSSDISEGAKQAMWQAPAVLAAGQWALKRYPKATIFGILAIGAYFGYQLIKKEKSPAVSHLH